MPSRLLTRMIASKTVHTTAIFSVRSFISAPPRPSNLHSPAGIVTSTCSGNTWQTRQTGQTAPNIRPRELRVNRRKRHLRVRPHVRPISGKRDYWSPASRPLPAWSSGKKTGRGIYSPVTSRAGIFALARRRTPHRYKDCPWSRWPPCEPRRTGRRFGPYCRYCPGFCRSCGRGTKRGCW